MFCFKRSLSEKFPCVEVIDRWLAGNISPVFRCAPTQVTYTASLHQCLCLCFTSAHHFCVPPTWVCVSLLCTTSVFQRPLPVFVFHPCTPLLCSTDLCLCFFCVTTIYRNRSGRSRNCSVSDKLLDRTLGQKTVCIVFKNISVFDMGHKLLI